MTELYQSVEDTAADVFSGHAGRPVTDLLRSLGSLGFVALGVPESLGGAGGGVELAGAVAYQAGQAGVHGSVLQQQIACMALGVEHSTADRAAVFAGQTPVAVAFGSASSRLRSPFGLAGPALVAVDLPGRRISFAPAQGVQAEIRDSGWLNPLGGDAVLAFSADPFTVPGDASRIRAVAEGLTAMFMVGTVSQLLADTAVYAGQRQQFGKPIASFQAVKHHLADAWIALRHARSLAAAALREFDSEPDTPAGTCSRAKLFAGDQALRAAELCLQVMGGMGFAWESDGHVRLKTVLRLRQWPLPALALRRSLSGG